MPALFAVALLAFDPNLLAHAGVVHTDLGAALAFLATVLAWDAAEQRPSAARVALAAACLGLALTTKFSAVYLVPILLLQTLLEARRGGGSGRRLLAGVGRLAIAGAGALLVVLAVYAPVTARMDRADQKAIIREKVGGLGKAPELAERIVALSDVSPPLAHYVGGLASVARQNAVGGGVTYLNGKVSTEGFPQYFFVAFAVKSTLAFLAVAARGPRRRSSPAAGPVARSGASSACRSLVLFLASIGTTYNIGIRHLLPVYPFLALFGAALFARAWARRAQSPGRRLAAGAWLALPLVAVVELARIHPHELSYFNPLAGGPEAGARILTGLERRLGPRPAPAAHGARPPRREAEDPTVAYFGGDNVSYRLGVPDFSALPVVRGRLVAISVFMLTAGPEFSAYHGARSHGRGAARPPARDRAFGRPVGRVGHSIYLFELPERETP